MPYELLQKPAFLNDLVQFERRDQKKICRAIDVILANPFGPDSKKILKHRFKNLYRLRAGDFRICYAVGTGCVSILAVGDRKEIYQRLEGLAAPAFPARTPTAEAGGDEEVKAVRRLTKEKSDACAGCCADTRSYVQASI
jgi:mRNA-degrading endonuclease RelE of RelBE toxin-antitoxin system